MDEERGEVQISRAEEERRIDTALQATGEEVEEEEDDDDEHEEREEQE